MWCVMSLSMSDRWAMSRAKSQAPKYLSRPSPSLTALNLFMSIVDCKLEINFVASWIFYRQKTSAGYTMLWEGIESPGEVRSRPLNCLFLLVLTTRQPSHEQTSKVNCRQLKEINCSEALALALMLNEREERWWCGLTDGDCQAVKAF